MNAPLLQTITVADSVIQVVEYLGNRVVTFAMIDQVHGRPEGTAKRNFGVNKSHLTEGEDYFELGKDEIRSNLQNGIFSKFAASGILITESGYLMLVKSFTDDLAWRVQKQLVKGYFKTKELIQNFDPMKTLLDPNALRGLLLGYSEKVIELETRVEEMTPTVEAFDRIATADGSLCLTDAAKALQIRPKDLTAKLSASKWIYKRTGSAHWLGYQDKVQLGYLEHKVTEVTRSDGTTKITEQVRILPKGLTKLSKELGNTIQAA